MVTSLFLLFVKILHFVQNDKHQDDQLYIFLRAAKVSPFNLECYDIRFCRLSLDIITNRERTEKCTR